MLVIIHAFEIIVLSVPVRKEIKGCVYHRTQRYKESNENFVSIFLMSLIIQYMFRFHGVGLASSVLTPLYVISPFKHLCRYNGQVN